MTDHKVDIANTITIGGVFSYLMEFQGEITVLVLLTGLTLNLLRLYDRFRKKRK